MSQGLKNEPPECVKAFFGYLNKNETINQNQSENETPLSQPEANSLSKAATETVGDVGVNLLQQMQSQSSVLNVSNHAPTEALYQTSGQAFGSKVTKKRPSKSGRSIP